MDGYSLAEVHVLLESLCGDGIPEQVHHLLALGRHLHLHHRVVEEVATILGRGDAHVVGRAQCENLHGHQAAVAIHEHPADMGEVGHGVAVQHTVVGVGDGLVQRVGTHAD